MKTWLFGSIALAAVWALPAAEEAEKPVEDKPSIAELERLSRSYSDTKLEVLRPIHDLQNLYQGELEKIRDELQQKGNLELILVVDSELSGFREGNSIQPPEGFAELKKAQSTYQAALRTRERRIEGSLNGIEAKYLGALEDLQADLTRKGRVADALQVKDYLDRLTEEAVPPPIVIELFWLPDFKGPSVKLEVPVEVGRFSQHPDLRNDSLRSIRIPEGVRVVVGSGAHLDGNTKRLSRDTADIDLTGISSLKAE